MIVRADGFEFDFVDAIDAFVFDEKDMAHDRFHGMPMKAVDVIVELVDKWFFIEMKDLAKAGDAYTLEPEQDSELFCKDTRVARLKSVLKYKFRDTYLFRHAEGKIDNRPVHYICLLTIDTALCTHLSSMLRMELPTKENNHRLWGRTLAQSCHVLNVKGWNNAFPRWPLLQYNV